MKELHADDYRGKPVNSCQGQAFKPFDARGYTVIECLHNLRGRPWDDCALGLVHGLRPSRIRVVADNEGTQCDAINWRVTVYLKKDGKTINRVEQEIEVGLPDGCPHGHALSIQTGVV